MYPFRGLFGGGRASEVRNFTGLKNAEGSTLVHLQGGNTHENSHLSLITLVPHGLFEGSELDSNSCLRSERNISTHDCQYMFTQHTANW